MVLSTGIQPQTHYSEQVFEKVHLEQHQLTSCEFHDCKFIGCSFTETVFDNCRFVHCLFKNSDLSLLRVPNSVFSATKMEGSKLIGVDWTQADWSSTKLADPIDFTKCDLSHSTFIGLNLKNIHITECIAKDVDFREADLTGAVFTGTDLIESLFNDTNLTEADLSRSRNYHIDPGQNVLKRTKFSLPEAMSLLYSLDIILDEGEELG